MITVLGLAIHDPFSDDPELREFALIPVSP